MHTLIRKQIEHSNIKGLQENHGAHHHHMDGHVHFEPGILSIHKYKGHCYHAYFKVIDMHEFYVCSYRQCEYKYKYISYMYIMCL